MFAFLVTQALKNRILVLVAAGVLVIFGALTASRLPVDVFPDLNRPTVTIMTEAEGLAPQEVEQLVTYPIETQMNGLPGVSRVRAVSGVGLSIVYVEFAWGTEIFRNRQQVAERLTLVQNQLPANTAPQMGPINSIMGQILLVAMTAPEGASPMNVRKIADFVVRPRLLTIPGVASKPLRTPIKSTGETLAKAKVRHFTFPAWPPFVSALPNTPRIDVSL